MLASEHDFFLLVLLLTTMSTPIASHTIKARWAQRLVREKLAAELNKLQEETRTLPLPIPGSQHWTHDRLPPAMEYKDGKRIIGDGDDPPPRKVCIVGAGVAGLYIAMILDSLKIPNLTYDILEANSRVGGRIYTHHFSEEPHDYYDIGAMRYPDIPIMKRTFDLFSLTKMRLIPYHLSEREPPNLFNDRFFDCSTTDPYHVSIRNGGSVPDDVVDTVRQKLETAFGPYKVKLAENFEEGFKELMTVDDFSTREFLKRGGPDGTQRHYDFFSI